LNDPNDKTFLPSVAFTQNQRGELRTDDAVGALSSGGGKPGQGYPAIAHTLKGEGFDAGEDGTGRGTPIVPVQTFSGNAESDVAATLETTRHDYSRADSFNVVAFNWQNGGGYGKANDGLGISIDHTPPQSRSQVAAVAFTQNQQGEVRTDDVVGALTSGGVKPGQGCPAAMQGMAVRRLTPEECESLQGFPRGFTQIPYRKKPAHQCPDGPRYKALGNSMAVPVMRWLGERIHQQHRQDLASQSPEWLGDMNLQIIKDVYGEKPMIEEQLKELVGATRAANDLLFEIKQVLVGLGASPTTETPAADSQPTSPAPIPASEAAAASAAAPPSPAAADPADSEAGPTKADVMAALRELDKAKGKSAVQGVLAQFKARNLTSLDAEKYAAVIEAAQDEAA
jgi:hypothetical protein